MIENINQLYIPKRVLIPKLPITLTWLRYIFLERKLAILVHNMLPPLNYENGTVNFRDLFYLIAR